jgi:hypothetical protein
MVPFSLGNLRLLFFVSHLLLNLIVRRFPLCHPLFKNTSQTGIVQKTSLSPWSPTSNPLGVACRGVARCPSDCLVRGHYTTNEVQHSWNLGTSPILTDPGGSCRYENS